MEIFHCTTTIPTVGQYTQDVTIQIFWSWNLEKNLVLGLTQDNSIENSVWECLHYY